MTISHFEGSNRLYARLFMLGGFSVIVCLSLTVVRVCCMHECLMLLGCCQRGRGACLSP